MEGNQRGIVACNATVSAIDTVIFKGYRNKRVMIKYVIARKTIHNVSPFPTNQLTLGTIFSISNQSINPRYDFLLTIFLRYDF
jgi:hypothetical protein